MADTSKAAEENDDMSVRAVEEQRLKEKMELMQKEMGEMEFEVKEYGMSGTYIIGGRSTEEVKQLVDEQLTITQEINTSPYKNLVEDQCQDWLDRLLLIKETLQEYEKCMNTWLELCPIFELDDTMRQMPVEGRKFMRVDTTYREVMDATKMNPNVLDVIAADGSLRDTLKAANETLDEIREQVLMVKRATLPQFRSITKDDLMDLLN